MNCKNLPIAFRKHAFIEQENKNVSFFSIWVKDKIKFYYDWLRLLNEEYIILGKWQGQVSKNLICGFLSLYTVWLNLMKKSSPFVS